MSSTDSTDEVDYDDNNLNGTKKRYYKMLLENNYISDFSKTQVKDFRQMEHSYSRDWRPMEGAQVMTTRTIMVHRPPPCPSCHVHSHDEVVSSSSERNKQHHHSHLIQLQGVDIGETYNPPIPSYNEEAAKVAMDECERIASVARISHQDDDDWEESINKVTWSLQQDTLFKNVAHILDLDHLARLANKERQHEPVLRRVVIDKAVARMRKALAKVSWEPRLTQWLHGLMMDSLPPTYMASYLDILQTLKSKVPALVDKMMFARPISTNQEILGPVLKKAWEPCVVHKNRKLPGQAIIVIVPASPVMAAPSARIQRWYSLFATMANVVPIQMNINGTIMVKQSLASVTEQMIIITRAKIQEIRAEVPTRQIILVGFNAGAALALQVALVETVNSVVCVGFAYNTANGIRGTPDDRILDLKTPVLFALGQNSSRSSQEEVESLREQMQAQTSLVVVGSADDALRVGKTKRQIEGVTQTMVDNMIMDEIFEFASTCIRNPPAPRDLAAENSAKLLNGAPAVRQSGTLPIPALSKKRKLTGQGREEVPPKIKAVRQQQIGRPRLNTTSSPKRSSLAPSTSTISVPKPAVTGGIQQPTSEALNMAIQSILPSKTMASASSTKEQFQPGDIVSSYEVMPNMDLRPITNQQPSTSSSVTITTSGGGSISLPSASTKLVPRPQQPPSLARMKVPMPPNQFVKLKPSNNVNMPKMFTMKTSTTKMQPLYNVRAQTTSSSSSVISTGRTTTNQVFTVKSTPTGTQLLPSKTKGQIVIKNPATTTSSGLIISPPKYKIMKPASQSTPSPLVKISPISTISKQTPDLSSTNIFDIPIVFADNDGNIQETAPTATTTTTAAMLPPTISVPPPPLHHTPIVLQNSSSTMNQLQNRNIYINAIPSKQNPNNKVLLINRGPIKGQPVQVTSNVSMVPSTGSGTTIPALVKYTKVNVSNASSINLPIRNTGGIDVRPIKMTTFKSSIPLGSKVEILNNSIIKPANTTLTTTVPTSIASISGSNLQKYQPIVINVDSDKTTIKNMITNKTVPTTINVASSSGIKPTNTIVIKPGGLKPMPMMKPGILNRNVTVRKVINLVPQKPGMQMQLIPANVSTNAPPTNVPSSGDDKTN